MVAAALSPAAPSLSRVDNAWVSATAGRVLDEVEQRRSTWQVWHVRAEALRQVRSADIPAGQVDSVVNLIVDEVLNTRSVLLASDADPITEPDVLRRTDGTSSYQVAGSEVFTSELILAAEERIVAAAGLTGGPVVAPETVDLALLESTANGINLNPGQAALVRELATSGARVQLAIAAAGTGKTTAMRVLTSAWEESGGTVIGLAPSAAAAAALAEQTGTTTDTLAKLIHSLNNGQSIDWMDSIGPKTLVLIDEAAMADTLTLDTAISFLNGRGASARLIGDDQQLAAIGAGGVLRDIEATHRAVRLTELMRFDDPGEGAATLALRDGLPEALGFYLDNQRVHVGDQTTLPDEVFTAWQSDCARGLDSIMLAPTRDLAANLNARARTARIGSQATPAGRAVWLADGNSASVGDLIITRTNDRRLRLSATDWVKNGDRWVVLDAGDDGRLKVQHARTRRRVTLPTAYVSASTELGYASTVHTAQGVSVDTMHGLATGDESRQQLYTMLTRGRRANHVYLQVTGDGDPHDLIRPETVHPKTATDILENILARDGAPKSATTMAREAAEPAVLLGQATARYTDALHASAETVLDPDRVTAIEQAADQMVPGIADEPAWPALRAHLILAETQGRDATRELSSAVAERELVGVDDRAAVLGWRLAATGLRVAGIGPLPWVPAIPARLAADPSWGPYLNARANRVETLAGQVRDAATDGEMPGWARHGTSLPDTSVGDVAVWRAAMGVRVDDRRPTGPPQKQKTAAMWQRHLDEQVTGDHSAALAEWGPLIHQLTPTQDEFAPLLAERLANLDRTGLAAADLLRTAAAEGPLPDDHVAAALWWRNSRHLSSSATTDMIGHGAGEDDNNLEHVATERNLSVRDRLENGAESKPAERWAQLAHSLDRRLVSQSDWAATAAMLQEVHDAGHDIPALTRQLVNQAPLGDLPAQDLRYRLVVYLPDDRVSGSPPQESVDLGEAERQHEMATTLSRRPDVGPRR